MIFSCKLNEFCFNLIYYVQFKFGTNILVQNYTLFILFLLKCK